MRYHAECFSGFADPRSQASSSHHTGKLAGTQFEAAPQRKAGSKMRSSAHFEGGGGDSRYAGAGASGKLAGYGVHGGGFGATSSKLNADGEAPPPPLRPTAPGDLTESALAQHLAQQNQQNG